MRRPAFPILPAHVDPQLRGWCQSVEQLLSLLPDLSIISTSGGPNANGMQGDLGALTIDIGSSVTRAWIKASASTSTTGWSAISHV